MNSFIPWVGGKGKLLWIINKMAPDHYTRFIDVFGGSGTVTMSRPIQPGCMEVYNDFNSNLTNLFCCVKNRPLALLAELGFLPLNTRDDFNVLYKFLSKGEITDDYLQEEMELTEILLKPPEAEAICTLLLERAPRGDVRRAADFFKLVRYSFSGSSKSFGGKPCDIRRFFHLIWECSRRLANVIVENKDFEDVIRQYDRGDAWIYCDPPYFEAECYEVAFPKENHQRLHDTLLNCQGYVMVSYNYCPYICELYHEFYIFRVVRPNSIWSRFLLTKPLYWCDFSGKVSAAILQRLSAGGCGSIVSKVSQSALLRKKNAHIGMQFGSLFRPQKKKCLNFLWKQGVQNPVFAAIGEGIIFLPAMNLDKHRLRRSYPAT